MRHLAIAAIAAGLAACGGGGPSRPAAPSPVPAPQSWILAGSVVETITAEPVGGAALAFNGAAAIAASSSGAWQLQGTGTAFNQQVVITAPGYLTRETTVRWDAGGRSDVRLDVVAERAPFDLAVFRQLVRNGFEEPAELRALRRWTRTPNFYVDATNPRTGQPLSAAETGMVERAIRAAIPQLTAGQLAAGVIEVGSGPGQTRADYIELTFVHEPDGDFCADALVGANPGRIRINYDRCPSACGSFSPETVAHEVGHAMGFWHTAAPGIMNTNRVRRCDNLEFSEVERFHARVAYSRPPGNLDPDRDPSTFSAIETAAPLRVVCRF